MLPICYHKEYIIIAYYYNTAEYVFCFDNSLIPPMRIEATIGVAYYPFMASMPQWELPHTKVEQAQRTVGL